MVARVVLLHAVRLLLLVLLLWGGAAWFHRRRMGLPAQIFFRAIIDAGFRVIERSAKVVSVYVRALIWQAIVVGGDYCYCKMVLHSDGFFI